MAGSTWPKDEDLLMNAFLKMSLPTTKLILVPHEVEAKSIADLESRLKEKNLSYSLYTDTDVQTDSKVMVVNAMGLLSRLYHYADLAYIGGGFNSGIHNCLEPAVFLKPLVFYGGDDYHKYNEALDLIEMKVAINIKDQAALELAIGQFLLNENLHHEVETKLAAYFKKNSGTSIKVLEKLSLFL